MSFSQREIVWTSPAGKVYKVKQLTLGQLLDTQERLKNLPSFSKIENVKDFRESIIALLVGLGISDAQNTLYELTLAEIGELIGHVIIQSQSGNPTRPPQGEVPAPLRKKK